MVKLIFICLGNICRSPMAEAIFQQMVEEADLAELILVESAGTSGWHNGEPAHGGTRDVLFRNGIQPGGRVYRGRSQEITYREYSDPSTYIVAMDQSNIDTLRQRFGDHPRLSLLLTYASDYEQTEVPDPYYTGGFDLVYELVQAGCRGLLQHIREQEKLP